MKSSIEFEWNPDEFPFLLESCKYDEGVQLSLRYLPNKDSKILEAGCGSGRVVKYLGDLGYKNVCGIELNHDIVRIQNHRYPELKIDLGDLLKLPYAANSFDAVVCYGVIEHFPMGLEAPLRAIYEVLTSAGVAIITIPSLNTLRQIKHFWGKPFHFLNLRENNYAEVSYF